MGNDQAKEQRLANWGTQIDDGPSAEELAMRERIAQALNAQAAAGNAAIINNENNIKNPLDDLSDIVKYGAVLAIAIGVITVIKK